MQKKFKSAIPFLLEKEFIFEANFHCIFQLYFIITVIRGEMSSQCCKLLHLFSVQSCQCVTCI